MSLNSHTSLPLLLSKLSLSPPAVAQRLFITEPVTHSASAPQYLTIVSFFFLFFFFACSWQLSEGAHLSVIHRHDNKNGKAGGQIPDTVQKKFSFSCFLFLRRRTSRSKEDLENGGFLPCDGLLTTLIKVEWRK